jgi:hypothetical protein
LLAVLLVVPFALILNALLLELDALLLLIMLVLVMLAAM